MKGAGERIASAEGRWGEAGLLQVALDPPKPRFERVRFSEPVPLKAGLGDRARRPASPQRPSALASCARPRLTDEGFKAFNRLYVGTLERWGIMKGDANPVARSSQAQKAVGARPASFRWRSILPNPASSGTGSEKRTRSMRKPGSAATPPEYWNGPGM